MREIIKKNIFILKKSGKILFLFEFMFKSVLGAVFYPLFLLCFNLSLKSAGIKYLTNGYIKVKKKNTERHIPLGNLSLKCLKEYINKVRPLLIRTEEEKTLFINTNGQKMTRQGYWKILKDL